MIPQITGETEGKTDASVPSRFEAAVTVTEFIPVDLSLSFHQLRPFPHLLWKPHRAIYWLVELAFGLFSLFALLAFLAAIPIVNFIALGYLLESEGRVARTGKLRYALPLLPLAPKLGGIAVGVWFWWWTVRLVADAASDATLIAPGTATDAAWQIGLIAFSIGVAMHLILAIARRTLEPLLLANATQRNLALETISKWRLFRMGQHSDSGIHFRIATAPSLLARAAWIWTRFCLVVLPHRTVFDASRYVKARTGDRHIIRRCDPDACSELGPISPSPFCRRKSLASHVRTKSDPGTLSKIPDPDTVVRSGALRVVAPVVPL